MNLNLLTVPCDILTVPESVLGAMVPRSDQGLGARMCVLLVR